MSDLKKLFEILLKNEIDFVLVGGFAGVVHGTRQVTQDIDICMAITEASVGELRKALKSYNPIHRMNPSFQPSFLDHPKNLEGLQNIYLKTDLGVLDVMSKLPPVGDYKEIEKNSIELSVYGYQCKVISIDDLIRIKESMNRPKDKEALLDLKKIKSIQNKND